MDTLSNLEIKILSLLSDGTDSREIAESLNVSYDTIRVHRNNILRKTEARSITHAVAQAIRLGKI